jgi:hypothetical protein
LKWDDERIIVVAVGFGQVQGSATNTESSGDDSLAGMSRWLGKSGGKKNFRHRLSSFVGL